MRLCSRGHRAAAGEGKLYKKFLFSKVREKSREFYFEVATDFDDCLFTMTIL